MPNAGNDLEPLASPPVLRQKGSIAVPRKGRAILVGGASYALVQAAGILIGKTGFAVDPALLQIFSVIAGGATFLFSASVTLVFCMRLISLQMLLACHVITKSSYIELRNAVQEAFKDSLKD